MIFWLIHKYGYVNKVLSFYYIAFMQLFPVSLINSIFFMFYASEKPSRVTKDLSELREITELRKNYGIAELRILKTEIRNNYGYGKAVILRIWQTTILQTLQTIADIENNCRHCGQLWIVDNCRQLQNFPQCCNTVLQHFNCSSHL